MVTAMISSGALDILIVRAAHTKIVTRPTVSAQLQLIFAAHPLGDFATTSLVVKVISSRRSKMRARQQHRTGVSTGRNPWAGADCRGTPRRRQCRTARAQTDPPVAHASHLLKRSSDPGRRCALTAQAGQLAEQQHRRKQHHGENHEPARQHNDGRISTATARF
jgi:hypothetical protein